MLELMFLFALGIPIGIAGGLIYWLCMCIKRKSFAPTWRLGTSTADLKEQRELRKMQMQVAQQQLNAPVRKARHRPRRGTISKERATKIATKERQQRYEALAARVAEGV